MFFLVLVHACLLLSSCFALQVSGLSELRNLKSGEEAQVQLKIINDSSNHEIIELHLVDYLCNDQGEHFFEPPSESKNLRSNVSWIQLGQKEIYLAPGQVRDVNYTIQVPHDESLKGSYWSVLLIEPKDPIPLKEDNQEGYRLQIKLRYAHHVIVNVNGGEPQLTIFKKDKVVIDDKSYLALHVLNEGDLFFDPAVTLKVYDDKGKLIKTLTSGAERLYPGNPQRFLLPVDESFRDVFERGFKGFIVFDDEKNHPFGDLFSYP